MKKFLNINKTVIGAIMIAFAIIGSTSLAAFAKRSAPEAVEEYTYYYANGDNWQPFEESYALGFLSLREPHCSDVSATSGGNICQFDGVTAKDLEQYVDYPSGASYLGEKYDVREYAWSIKGSCPVNINVSSTSYATGSITRNCDSVTIREFHFYPFGTLGQNSNGVYKTPSQSELAQAEYQVKAGTGTNHGFRGVMRLDGLKSTEGYAIPIGNNGVWTTYDTQTLVEVASDLEGQILGDTLIDHVNYKWTGNWEETTSSNSRTAMWVQFESIASNPNDTVDSGMPATLAYYTSGGTSSGISHQSYSVTYELFGDIPAALASNNQSAYGQKVATIAVAAYGLYDPYSYYQQLLSNIPEGYALDGWYDRETGEKIANDSSLETISSDREYYGYITARQSDSTDTEPSNPSSETDLDNNTSHDTTNPTERDVDSGIAPVANDSSNSSTATSTVVSQTVATDSASGVVLHTSDNSVVSVPNTGENTKKRYPISQNSSLFIGLKIGIALIGFIGAIQIIISRNHKIHF